MMAEPMDIADAWITGERQREERDEAIGRAWLSLLIEGDPDMVGAVISNLAERRHTSHLNAVANLQVSATTFMRNFGAIASKVRKGTYPEVIVENRGEPIVAIVRIEELQAVRAFRDKKKSDAALALLRQARDDVQARLGKKLTDSEALQRADRVSRELVKDMAKRGKAKFERTS
jgi:hypothetical protein